VQSKPNPILIDNDRSESGAGMVVSGVTLVGRKVMVHGAERGKRKVLKLEHKGIEL
jgi:hypothetical protein